MNVLIVGEAPNKTGGGLTRTRISELAGRPWDEWADWTNLLDEWPGSGRGKGTAWNATFARRVADGLDLSGYETVILLGRRVGGAMIPGGAGFPYFRWTERGGVRMVVIPHTSGIVRWWNDPENVAKASSFLTDLASSKHASIATGVTVEGMSPSEEGEQQMAATAATKRRTRKTAAAAREAAPTKRASRKTATAPAVEKEQKLTGRAAVIAAIRAAGKPLTPNEAAALVIDSGVADTLDVKGDTPMDYRLAAPVYREAKKGRFYELVSTGPSKFKVKSDAPTSDPELVATLKKQVEKATAAAKKAAEKK